MVNALDMAIRNRRPEPGVIVHADHGTQFASWVFGAKIRSAGLLPSFGSIGAAVPCGSHTYSLPMGTINLVE